MIDQKFGKLIKLTVENVKKVKAVEIMPDGHMTIIGGKNGQGKSSTIDGLAYSLGGKRLIPSRPVRDGAEKGMVEAEFENVTVKRIIKKDGSGSIVVRSSAGAIFPSPQKMLDTHTSAIGFDVMWFMRQAAGEQARIIRELTGCDTSELDAKRAKMYSRRTDIGKDVIRLQGHLDLIPTYADARNESVDVSALMQKLEDIEIENSGIRDIADESSRVHGSIEDSKGLIKDIEKKLKDAKWLLADLQKESKTLEKSVRDVIDTSDLRAEIAGAEGINSAIRGREKYLAAVADLDEAKKMRDSMSSVIKGIDAEKTKMLALVEFPVEGMSVEDGALTYCGFPLDQASSAEQLRVSVAVGIKMNPDPCLLLVRDGSLLDKDSRVLLSEMAKAAEAQVLLEVAEEGDECQVIIEDGTVRGA